jgi:hypothetical protein
MLYCWSITCCSCCEQFDVLIVLFACVVIITTEFICNLLKFVWSYWMHKIVWMLFAPAQRALICSVQWRSIFCPGAAISRLRWRKILRRARYRFIARSLRRLQHRNMQYYKLYFKISDSVLSIKSWVTYIRRRECLLLSNDLPCLANPLASRHGVAILQVSVFLPLRCILPASYRFSAATY